MIILLRISACKNYTIRAVLAIVLIAVTVFTTHAQAPAGAEAFLQKQMKERNIPGMQVAVVKQGRIVFLKTYGYSNIQDSVRATDKTMFSINSCTKSITGVAVMQLVEEGKISLDAPVSRYLDNLPQAWQPVTVKQLLTHVSGLPDILRVLNQANHNFMPGDNEEKAWKKVEAMPMDFTPGEQFSYNQTNYALLGKIITRYSGKPFETVFQERQLNVAGMTHTRFADSRNVMSGLAQNYYFTSQWDGTSLAKPILIQGYAEFPAFHHTASGMVSTAQDMAQWIIALQQHKLLQAPALKTLWTPGRYNNGQPTQWALGLTTRPREKHPAVMMTGGGRSVYCIYPDDNFAVVVLTNLGGSSPEDFIDEFVAYFEPEIAAADPLTALRLQIHKRGFGDVMNIVKDLRKKDAAYTVPESELNDWGYRLMGSQQTKEAIAIFSLVVSLYPESWNAYDSYGEGLMKNGQRDEAIKMYQKSIDLYPGNTNGKRILEKLLKG